MSNARSLQPIRVVLVDDHWVVRKGLRMFLERDAAFDVIGEVADGAAAIQMATELRPDVVLMDLLMPVLDGITAIAAIRQTVPDVEVLALTSVIEEEQVVRAIRAGAIGYVLKDAHGEELKAAVRAAAQGQVYLSPRAAALLLKQMRAP